MRLAGSVAVVATTGGDLGAAIAGAMRAEGAAVVLSEDEGAADALRAVIDAHARLDAVVVTDASIAPAWLAASAPLLASGGGGSITTVVTTRALAGDLRGWQESADGGAAIALTRAVATTHGKSGVRANALAIPPADVDVELQRRSTLLPRALRTADVAALAVFLASADAAFVTGQCLRCDGGSLAHLPHYAALVESGTTTTGG